MTKRVGLFLTLGLLVFGSLAVAETAVPETPGATVGGDLVIGVSQTFKDLDPRISNSAYDSYVIDVVYDGLIILHPETLEPSPWIAKSWDIISDEQVRFYLNEGVTFHNGEALTAEDVAFTFNWIADEANNSPNMTELQWMLEAVVVDEYTVDIFTKPEYAPFAPGFGNETQAIVPMDYVTEVGDDAFNLDPVGSGPFVFVEWLPGDHITVERNEDYWLVYPNLDTITYRPIPELSVMMLELESGGIHIADNMPAADVPRFQANPDVDVLQVGSLSYFHMFFNLLSPISSDIRFRKAVYQSVDMEAAVFSIFQNLTGVKAYGCIPPALWANDQEYLKENVYLEEDDEEAMRLFGELRAEGILPAGYTVRVHTPLDPRRRQLATILATSLIENGVDAQVVPLDWGPLLDLAYRSESDPVGDFEMMWMGWSGGPDPHDFAYYLFHSDNATVGSADNMSWTMIPEVDQLINEADTTLDVAVREAKYVEAQRLIYENYSAIPGYHYVQTTAIRANVEGFLVHPLGTLWITTPYHNVWLSS
jgi:peptide/nickel transport system substrate-binding protein